MSDSRTVGGLPIVHVSIGEVKVGRGTDILKASLGSCVGIAFLWKRRGVHGLAHCLLPEAPPELAHKIGTISARFVSQAVPSLLALMRIAPEDRNEIDVVLVGGGNMTAPAEADATTLVGTLNSEAGVKYLKHFGMNLVHKDVGGEAGRKIWVYCETGEYKVEVIPRIGAVDA
jgi:chemotaxis protein CheD